MDMSHARDSESKTAVYVRVSTFDQEKGIQSQEMALRQYLEGHGVADAVWYTDRLSGATMQRPAFKRLQKEIFAGRVQTVVCWKLDRLSRSLKDGINTLCDWIEKGVRIVAVSQELDFSGPAGKLIASVLFSLAEMERENLRENTKRGLMAAKARGVKLGRRPTIHADDIVTLLRAGLPVAEVAQRRMGIYKCLRRAGVDPKAMRARVAAGL
jgi:DNA invertase Pin-like site-specific DNA recombinase